MEKINTTANPLARFAQRDEATGDWTNLVIHRGGHKAVPVQHLRRVEP